MTTDGLSASSGVRLLALGRRVRVEGDWRGRAGQAGTLRVHRAARVPDRAPWRGWRVRWMGVLRGRTDALFVDTAPLVAALLLADRAGMDAAVRERFARTGVAHLLAISGFHVGVVAGMVYGLLRTLGLGRGGAGLWATMFVWLYVAFLGFPDAATRAAVILTAAAVGRARGRPVARGAPLATAFLLLVLDDPARLAGVGFQLSFAGAAGLTLGSRSLTEWLARRARMPRTAASAVSAGICATASTLPFVAWHFQRMSLVGIPVTLVAGPLVGAALPGAVAGLVLDPIWPAAAHFIASGVQGLLQLLNAVVAVAAGWPFASVAVGRPDVLAGAVAIAGGAICLRWVPAGRTRPAVRRVIAMAGGVSAMALWPVATGLRGRGTLEIIVVDVGQGDAILLHSPAGRWAMVDAGPAAREGSGRDARIVPALRRWGVHRLAYLVLTHPDMDHIGGAEDALREVEIGEVLDPGYAAGKSRYVETLREARARALPWVRAERGMTLAFDGVRLRVVWPPGPDEAPPPGVEDAEGSAANAVSVVVLVSYHGFTALLTGDAPTAVERVLLPELPDHLDVLKVGHHGSRTSTDSLLLDRTRPEVAVVSVGRRNRYGHPSPSVIARLRRARVRVLRTDVLGSIRIRVGPDGRWSAAPAARH